MVDITDGQSEIEFLASKAAQGKLIIVTNNISSTGTLTSYTPITGNTFILYRAKISCSMTRDSSFIVNLKNDTTVVDTIVLHNSTSAPTTYSMQGGAFTKEFIIRGDQLIGTGSKKYEINVGTNGASDTIYGTIIGYLL